MKNFFNLLVVLAITFFSSWALFNGSFYRIHDFTHAGRFTEMANALKDGHFPVTWSENFGFGYGMPLFLFYAPLPYYIGGILVLLGFNVVFVIKFLYFFINYFSTLGAFLLGKKLFKNNQAAILSAVSFTFFSYRALNLFVRGAMSEVMALMFLPWILYFSLKIIEKNKLSFDFLNLSLVWFGLFLSHNLTTMMFTPFYWVFIFFYLLILFLTKQMELKVLKTIFIRLALTFLLAIGLASFYLIPSFVEKDSTYLNEMTLGGYFDFHQHFLFIRQFFQNNWGYGGSEPGPNDGMSFYLGTGQLIGLFFAFILFLKLAFQFLKEKSQKIETNFFMLLLLSVLLGLSLLMTLGKTKIIWESFHLLSYIQFPWRYLSLSALFLSLVVANSVFLFNKSFFRKTYALVIFCLIVFTSINYFVGEELLDDSEVFYYNDDSRIRNELSFILMDYFPKNENIEVDLEKIQPINNLILNSDASKEAEIIVNRVHEKLIKTNFQNKKVLDLGIAYYDGWRVEIDGKKANFDIGQDVGNIQIEIPPGEHLVGVYFTNNLIRNIAIILSLLSFFVYFYLYFYLRKSNAS